MALLAFVAVLAACARATGPTDEPAVPSSGGQPLVSFGVRYAAAPEGWSDPTLDLYLPSDAGTPPVVLIVPDAGADPKAPDYAGLARDIAARGVVASVAGWGVESPELTRVAGRSAEDLVTQARQGTAEVSCALGVTAAKVGGDVGTAERRLLVVGHGAGANAAAMAVLTPAPEFAGCFAAGEAPHVAAAILWDGDWLGAVAGDALGAGASSFLAAYSPWPSVDGLDASTYVELGVNANRLEGRAVEVRQTSSYLTARDPDGTITEDLERVDAFADGAIDPVDITRAFSVALGDGGVASRERELHGEGDPDVLGAGVRAQIVQSVVQLTRP